MKKYLDILIFTLIFFLLFSYFQGKNTETPLSGVSFTTLSNSYSVPAAVTLSVTNDTPRTLSFQSCEALTLRQAGVKVDIPSDMCQEVILASREVYTLDLSAYYTLFETPSSWTAEFEVDDIKLVSQFEIVYRGSIGKFFVGVFYAPMYNLIAYFIQFFGNSLGWAIVSVTIIIRILLLFPQHKMMVSQRKLQALQPKIKEIQTKYKGKQQELGLELMKLYKTEKVNPFGSLGFLLIQMPILIVLYQIIINITSVKNEFYLYGFLPEFHISQIEYVFYGINLLGSGGVVGIILALSIAVIQFVQIKLSFAHMQAKKASETGVVLEKKQGEKDYSSMMPDPEVMQKFMLYGMPVMVGIFTYTFIAGVGFYWGISTLFAIGQQLFVNKIIKK